MSLINGDKGRAGRQRKAKLAKRAKNQVLRSTVVMTKTEGTAAAVAPRHSTKAAVKFTKKRS